MGNQTLIALVDTSKPAEKGNREGNMKNVKKQMKKVEENT